MEVNRREFVGGALAVAAAWWRVGIGGLLVILMGTAHCAFAWVAAGHHKLYAMTIAGVPFLAVGVLFLASWWLARGQDNTLA